MDIGGRLQGSQQVLWGVGHVAGVEGGDVLQSGFEVSTNTVTDGLPVSGLGEQPLAGYATLLGERSYQKHIFHVSVLGHSGVRHEGDLAYTVGLTPLDDWLQSSVYSLSLVVIHTGDGGKTKAALGGVKVASVDGKTFRHKVCTLNLVWNLLIDIYYSV